MVVAEEPGLLLSRGLSEEPGVVAAEPRIANELGVVAEEPAVVGRGARGC